MRIVLLAKRVAREIRDASRVMREEDGGALFGVTEHGDVTAQVRAARSSKRSPSIIRIEGRDIETEARAVMEQDRTAGWLGFWHLHFELARLSGGDLRTIDGLHDTGRVPDCGLVKVLAVKRGVEPIELMGFVSPQKGVVEQADLFEVDDVVQARGQLANGIDVPGTRPHVLGSNAASTRFKEELNALESEGYVVKAEVVAQGVELTLSRPDLHGELVVTIAAEGWERPPKLVHRVAGNAKLITSPLASFLSAWSSAFSLKDVVTQARTRAAWPRHAVPRLKNPEKEAAT